MKTFNLTTLIAVLSFFSLMSVFSQEEGASFKSFKANADWGGDVSLRSSKVIVDKEKEITNRVFESLMPQSDPEPIIIRTDMHGKVKPVHIQEYFIPDMPYQVDGKVVVVTEQ